MKLLSRIGIVFVLLGSLAYGSYALGKYVLSNKLFGPNVMAGGKGGASGTRSASTASNSLSDGVTRRVHLKGDKPRVEVSVLPADDAGDAPEPSGPDERSSDSTAKTPRSNSGEKIVSSQDFANLPTASQNAANPDNPDASAPTIERPRKHRRKHRSTQNKTAAAAPDATTSQPAAAPDNSNSGTASGNDGVTISGDSGTTAAPSTSGSSSGPSTERIARPRRERVRHHSSDNTETSRPTSRSRDDAAGESPVPRPERSDGGSSGGDSPVPRPE